MANGKYIPTGRTSLVHKEDGSSLQVQTEYSPNPYARIATTVTEKGRVVHKIEKKLKRIIETMEEQLHLERVMHRQHSEVEKIIEAEDHEAVVANSSQSIEIPSPELWPPPAVELVPISEPEPLEEKDILEKQLEELGIGQREDFSIMEGLRSIAGVENIYHLDALGNFKGSHSQKIFRKEFSKIFKNLQDLMNIFALLDGSQPMREYGVCEIEPDRLYYASAGEDCYFITVRRTDQDTNFESAIKSVLGL